MKKRRKTRPPKIFIVKDIHGREWTTKEGLMKIYGVYAADTKKYFYELEKRK